MLSWKIFLVLLTNHTGDKMTKVQATQDAENGPRNLERDSFSYWNKLQSLQLLVHIFLNLFTIKRWVECLLRADGERRFTRMYSLLKEGIFLYSSIFNTWRDIVLVVPSCGHSSYHLAMTPKSKIKSRSSRGRWEGMYLQLWNTAQGISCHRGFNCKNHSRCYLHMIILIISIMKAQKLWYVILFSPGTQWFGLNI